MSTQPLWSRTRGKSPSKVCIALTLSTYPEPHTHDPHCIAPLAMELIVHTLERDPDKRWSAQEARECAWLVDLPRTSLEEVDAPTAVVLSKKRSHSPSSSAPITNDGSGARLDSVSVALADVLVAEAHPAKKAITTQGAGEGNGGQSKGKGKKKGKGNGKAVASKKVAKDLTAPVRARATQQPRANPAAPGSSKPA